MATIWPRLGCPRARTPSRAAQLGAIAFLLRPTYIATEYVTAVATTGGYSFVSDSVSKLGRSAARRATARRATR